MKCSFSDNKNSPVCLETRENSQQPSTQMMEKASLSTCF